MQETQLANLRLVNWTISLNAWRSPRSPLVKRSVSDKCNNAQVQVSSFLSWVEVQAKLLDEVCVQPLLDMCPQFQLEGVSVNSAMTRSSNVQVTDMIGKLRTSKSLQTFSRSFIAQAHHIFEELPSDLKTQGLESGLSLDGCLYSRQGNGPWRRINYRMFILQQISRNLELSARVRVLN